ncbi:hypothetical protein [Rhizobacter sp. SG703]|uniref:hypothetical protein n=1 Tax=Rhizobacter sp. SG703 TaxID=2587140 RepID=UPI00183A2788|nr:hypothetical protein [Rhizobacter sp. SG703]NKI96097.1 hypothetical protein [Rhizobacter sp. SG703]
MDSRIQEQPLPGQRPQREELAAANSMLLRELYFGCLGGDGNAMTPAMALALDANFGSVAR